MYRYYYLKEYTEMGLRGKLFMERGAGNIVSKKLPDHDFGKSIVPIRLKGDHEPRILFDAETCTVHVALKDGAEPTREMLEVEAFFNSFQDAEAYEKFEKLYPDYLRTRGDWFYDHDFSNVAIHIIRMARQGKMQHLVDEAWKVDLQVPIHPRDFKGCALLVDGKHISNKDSRISLDFVHGVGVITNLCIADGAESHPMLYRATTVVLRNIEAQYQNPPSKVIMWNGSKLFTEPNRTKMLEMDDDDYDATVVLQYGATLYPSNHYYPVKVLYRGGSFYQQKSIPCPFKEQPAQEAIRLKKSAFGVIKHNEY